MIKYVVVFFAAVAISACNNSAPVDGKSKPKPTNNPKPGTIIAQDEMPVEDPLNHFTFSVKVIADSTPGTYDVDADFGPNYANSQLAMPAGLEDARPVIRRGSEPYTFIIGFRHGSDTTFHDYFQVSSNKHTTKMQYIKAYLFE